MAKIKRTEYTPLDPGLYPAQVGDVTTEAGQFGEQIRIKFVLDDDEEAGIEDRSLIGWASATFGPKSKLWGWVRVLLFGGRDIPDEFGELDTDALKGKRCLLSVTTKVGNDGSVYNKIADLLPAVKAKRNGATVPAATPGGSAGTVPAPPAPPVSGPVVWNVQAAPGWTGEDSEGWPF